MVLRGPASTRNHMCGAAKTSPRFREASSPSPDYSVSAGKRAVRDDPNPSLNSTSVGVFSRKTIRKLPIRWKIAKEDEAWNAKLFGLLGKDQVWNTCT